MSTSVNNITQIKSGTCPHGCAPSACPICSGMGGGSSMRAGERLQKPGEMSYHECAIIGAMMKARKDAQLHHKHNLQVQADILKTFIKHLEKASAKLAAFNLSLSNKFLFKPIVFFVNTFVLPLIKFAKNTVFNLNNIIYKLSEFKIDIQDKLNSIFGEIKLFVDKKVSEFVSGLKAKISSLFKIFKRNNTKDDETKIDEDKKLFRIKIFITKIWKREKDGNTKD